MPQPRSLLRGEITYSNAKREEVNILHRLEYPKKRTQFLAHIAEKHDWIKAIIGHHLNLKSSSCHVASVEDWRHGSFNICIPVTIENWEEKQQPGRRVVPHRHLDQVPDPSHSVLASEIAYALHTKFTNTEDWRGFHYLCLKEERQWQSLLESGEYSKIPFATFYHARAWCGGHVGTTGSILLDRHDNITPLGKRTCVIFDRYEWLSGVVRLKFRKAMEGEWEGYSEMRDLVLDISFVRRLQETGLEFNCKWEQAEPAEYSSSVQRRM